ncbi:hypothetical protein [Liquorilactobacillus ghanensis]|uniref:hypothetical protein n=1 Tax=Liquorilactobacillus ghanensis TaxID=399370 RepID=UPI0039E951AD
MLIQRAGVAESPAEHRLLNGPLRVRPTQQLLLVLRNARYASVIRDVLASWKRVWFLK